MSDFASAAMMRLIRLGLQRQGLDRAVPAARGSAVVPLADKQQLAQQLLQSCGSTAMLRIGEAITDALDEPALKALLIATDPMDLISRWQRLERFMHSRHRVLATAAAGGVVLRHISLDRSKPPQKADDLLIFGLLAALISQTGGADIKARFAGQRRWHFQHGQWSKSTAPAETGCWEITWRTVARRTAPEYAAGSGWEAMLRQLFADDPGRGWSIPALADELKIPPRSLQRYLAAKGKTFTGLLADARVARAATLLTHTRQSPAEIGYACGFADQAHFTRKFKRQSALTPVQFRKQFAVAC